uniref:insulinase family protein n=1 Tax=Ningiella ruwaisensis TaxID=2364274 RepID=UPI00109F8C29|nr:insulinase family protein [Ningiella ruwaisensis]
MYLPKNAKQNLVVETLPNQLKLAVIRSDAIAMPIISVSVAIGHYHETSQCYGFSHLLEHMIFHRSKNFDSSDTLEKLVNQCGGYINGWTHSKHMNFHLTCDHTGFTQAVKILCDKISHPVFEPKDIESEINAIDEEFRLKQQDPVRCLFSVKRAVSNPAHPFHRFPVGNKASFSAQTTEQLSEALKRHHERYFHSGNIAVCIKLPEQDVQNPMLDDIRDILSKGIKAGRANHRLLLPPMYQSEMQSTLISVKAKHMHRQLIIAFLVKKRGLELDTKAFKMLRHIFESQNKNGLFDELIAKQWIRSISLTGGVEQTDAEEVQLHLSLADEGANHVDEIISIVKGFLDFLSARQLASWRFSELEKQQGLMEQFADRRDPIETCIECATQLHLLAEEKPDGQIKPSSATTHSDSFSRTKLNLGRISDTPISIQSVKQRTNEIIKDMRNGLHHVYLIDENVQGDRMSTFYQVEYRVSKLQNLPVKTNIQFMLSPQNTYLPSQLLLVTPEIPSDKLELIEQHGVKLKFAQIIANNEPCGDCFVSINSPAMCDTIAHTMSKKVWVEGLSHYLKRRFYQAEEAGISFRVYGHQHGLCVHTTGFSDKQLLLSIEIINCLINFHLKEEEYEAVKSAIIKRLTNSLVQKPINQMFANLNTLIQGDTYSIHQQVNAVKSLSFAELNQHQSHFFDRIAVEALLVGNWRKYAAQRFHQQLQSRLTSRGVWEKPRIVANEIKQAVLPELPPLCQQHANDIAIVQYQQVKNVSDNLSYLPEHATGICLLLEHILSPHIFSRIRKKKQLAYLVGVGYKPINSQPGIAIYLQSSKTDAGAAYQAICEVIQDRIQNWDETVSDIHKAREKVMEQCQPMNRDVASIARRLWENFDKQDAFYYYKRLQNAVRDIKNEELKLWLERLSMPSEGQAILTNDKNALSQHAFNGFYKNLKIS